ncbi:hypothetical protein [Curtobacterium sp. MCBD17_032]|uniref:hypothetical protein n=1 Tax=Curtobacterium sp. MCBD17_032 TaxID=2175659 RepID=UPI000DA87F66|nr:hypothetical protein [Curtobacterium sp. MCBD17_032]PZE82470.1 hypothetical protein DEI91_11695 [Curtobacterium sp. MCBD17_032]
MQWWNDLIDWTSSDTGWRVLSGAVIPFVAIIVAGIIAALIGRGAAKRVVAHQERESRNAAVAALVSAARKASDWGSLGHDERAYADHLAEDADIRLRLLPIAGAPIAADWAQHEIADIKKNSSTFTSQADTSLAEFRDRMLEWQARPNRARKLFKSDLERWKFDAPDPDADLIKRQQEWNADKVDASRSPEPAPTPTTTSLRPAQPSVVPASPSPSQSGQDATVPISDNATRPYSEGETTPIRPTLGSPAFRAPAPTPAATAPGWSASRDTDNDDAVDDVRIDTPSRSGSADRSPAQRNEQPARNDLPAPRDGRSLDGDQVRDDQGDDVAAPSAASYANPVSASELRRRADDDE